VWQPEDLEQRPAGFDIGREAQTLDRRFELPVDVVRAGPSRFERAKCGRVEQAGLDAGADRRPHRVSERALGLDLSRERGRSKAPETLEAREQPRHYGSSGLIDEIATERVAERDSAEMHFGDGT
jgi:hypothetical protein